MSASSQSPYSRQDGRSVTLIPVGLKEAALDSPTFRSGFTHFSEQVDYLEKWLENYVRSITKLSQEIGTFEGLVNGFLTTVSSPPYVSEAVIDHDHTLLAMKRYAEGARDFWTTTIFGLKRMDTNMVEPIRAFLQNDLRSFKEARRNMEQSQKQLDILQSRYSTQTKSKDPAALREDAYQLHEVRKTRLKASMDFGVAAPSLRIALDKMLVKMFSDQYRDMRIPWEHVGGSVGRWGADIERIRGWSRELESGEKMFRQELQTARKQIEENAGMAMRPSRDLDDYNVASSSAIGVKTPSTNQQSPSRCNTNRPEKHSWLNLRMMVGKPARVVWLRRWFYVKNGVFGWFIQGSRSGGVEEGEKIGVLLCSVKIAVQEDRRFCFEVKTKDTTNILQAETQAELLDWIDAFETAKKMAVEEPSSLGSLALAGPRGSDAAFAILPPSAQEFTASGAELGVQHGDENSSAMLDRTATLTMPGGDLSSNPATRGSFDLGTHRGSTHGDRDGESGKDHVLRIIQKRDLVPRKSTSGPPTNPGIPLPSSPTSSGAGRASLVAASHDSMPAGAGSLPNAISSDNAITRSSSLLNVRDLPPTTLAPGTLINPPAPTNLSTIAVMVAGERVISEGHVDVTDAISSGIMANIWGSSSWTYLNELRDPQESPSSVPGIPADSTDAPGNEESFAGSRTPSPSRRPHDSPEHDGITQLSTFPQQGYPTYYPLQMRTHDAQFRLLIPHAGRDERLVLVFKASWNPNDKQQFPGRVYASANKFYFYSNHLGLVLISEINLNTVSEVTAAPGRDCDFLFVHLKVREGSNRPTRITIKTFLEPLRLLQRRLNFLIRNCSMPEGRDLELIMKSLIKMEQDDSASSPSLESWEDISMNTPFDGGSRSNGRASPGGRHRDLRTKVLVDGRLHSGSRKPDQSKELAKFKLPGQPVDYVPSGMDRLAVEQIFNVSPKTLFHVMFGDRSVLWQSLYHEGRAQGIKQGSWNQVKQGHLRREFEYQVERHDMFGRPSMVTVVDCQMIDVSNDHLCYVVTERKTPWRLPCSQDFQLLSRVVITYFAKSKCRLAIYSKVDWTKPPGFAKDIVTRRALDDLELDALDLSDVITSQIKKLGAQSHTKKAIQIFGLIGQETRVSEFKGSEIPLMISRTQRPVKSRTLAGLYLESLGSLIRICISSLLLRAVNFLQWTSKTVNANSILLAFLVVSVIINLIFSSTRASEWWMEQKPGKMMAHMGVGPRLSMSKAIYLQDLYDAGVGEAGGVDRPESTCHETFRKIVSLTDMDAHTSAEASPFGASSRATARRLRLTRQEMGSHRHDLLVALRVINSIEREMMQAEWEHWLVGENRKCEELGMVIRENRSEALQPNQIDVRDRLKGKYSHDGQIRSWHESYCESCSHERIRQLRGRAGASERRWTVVK